MTGRADCSKNAAVGGAGSSPAAGAGPAPGSLMPLLHGCESDGVRWVSLYEST